MLVISHKLRVSTKHPWCNRKEGFGVWTDLRRKIYTRRCRRCDRTWKGQVPQPALLLGRNHHRPAIAGGLISAISDSECEG
jgi:hypothetical protein